MIWPLCAELPKILCFFIHPFTNMIYYYSPAYRASFVGESKTVETMDTEILTTPKGLLRDDFACCMVSGGVHFLPLASLEAAA